jgi:hypothetical protein
MRYIEHGSMYTQEYIRGVLYIYIEIPTWEKCFGSRDYLVSRPGPARHRHMEAHLGYIFMYWTCIWITEECSVAERSTSC